MRNSGSSEKPYTRDDWLRSHGPLWPTVNFPPSKRPSARRGDRMFWHAIGSNSLLGEAKFFALGEVTSDEPFLSERERWPWALEVQILIAIPLLSAAPSLGDVGIERSSLRRQAYIKMDPVRGKRAERLLLQAASAL